MRKKFCGIIRLAIVFCFIAATSDAQTNEPDIVILHTGDFRSEISPSGSCCQKIGGSRRIASIVRKMRDAFPDLLLLDAGDYLWRDRDDILYEVKTLHALKLLKILQYDVLNIGEGEIALSDRLDGLREPRVVNANITGTGAALAKREPYVIKDIGDLKIGILGVTSSKFLKDAAAEKNLTVANPKATLRKLVPEIRKKAGIVVVLSHLGWEESGDIAASIPGIDIVIVGHDGDYEDYEPKRVNSTLMVKNSIGGGLAGVIKIWAGRSGKVKSMQSELIPLDKQITVYKEYKRLEREYRSHKFAYLNFLRNEEMARLSGDEKERFRKMTGTTGQLIKYLKNRDGRLSFETFLKTSHSKKQ